MGIQKLVICAAFLLFAHVAQATEWVVDKAQSTLQFEATQNNAPVKGEFKTFEAEIIFDPKQLASSHILIVVDPASVSASYEEVPEELKQPVWLNAKAFPEAIFESTSVRASENNSYIAEGSLTLKGRSLPIQVVFSFKELTANKAVAIGQTTFKRLDYNVGEGDWAKTNVVKDEVKVTFTLTATAKK